MISRIIKMEEALQIGVGSILLAKPFWQDEKYKRSVILVLEHDEFGSSGVILNKLSTACVKDILPDTDFPHPVYYGGPCEVEIISFLHNKSLIPGCIQLANGLYIGGNFEEMKKIITQKRIRIHDVKFIVGHVGWLKGQLDEEVRQQKWWIESIASDELFRDNWDELWASKLIQSGHVYGVFNKYPDPIMN
jgi:putative transcriptional regulator